MSEKQLKYFVWYYGKYLPSKKRLFEKIDDRVEDLELRKKVKDQMEPFLAEEQILEDKVRNLLLHGKTPFYISQNLTRKGFERSMIEEVLHQDDLSEDFDTLRRAIEPKVKAWIRQRKSRHEIRQKLFEHRGFGDEIADYIDEVYPPDHEVQSIESHILGLRAKGYDDQKILQRLGAKGFYLSDIRDQL